MRIANLRSACLTGILAVVLLLPSAVEAITVERVVVLGGQNIFQEELRDPPVPCRGKPSISLTKVIE
jgi:hypothetical protein